RDHRPGTLVLGRSSSVAPRRPRSGGTPLVPALKRRATVKPSLRDAGLLMLYPLSRRCNAGLPSSRRSATPPACRDASSAQAKEQEDAYAVFISPPYPPTRGREPERLKSIFANRIQLYEEGYDAPTRFSSLNPSGLNPTIAIRPGAEAPTGGES